MYACMYGCMDVCMYARTADPLSMSRSCCNIRPMDMSMFVWPKVGVYSCAYVGRMRYGSRLHGEAACDQVVGAKAQAAGRRLAGGTVC